MGVQSQKEAVFSAVTSVLSEAGVNVNEGDNFADHLTREHRAQVTNILVEGFNSGAIELSKSFSSEADLRTYCSGLTSNWLRKDTRMNGGTKYVAKNPGSRVGSSDPQLKAMRMLLSTKTDPAERAEIQSFIDSRVSEVKASKKPAKSIDFSALPAELASKYSSSNS
jgi:hypothetical protein